MISAFSEWEPSKERGLECSIAYDAMKFSHLSLITCLKIFLLPHAAGSLVLTTVRPALTDTNATERHAKDGKRQVPIL